MWLRLRLLPPANLQVQMNFNYIITHTHMHTHKAALIDILIKENRHLIYEPSSPNNAKFIAIISSELWGDLSPESHEPYQHQERERERERCFSARQSLLQVNKQITNINMGQKWVLTCNSARFPFLCAAGSQSMAKFPDPYPFSSRARRDKHNMQMQVRLQCSKGARGTCFTYTGKQQQLD